MRRLVLIAVLLLPPLLVGCVYTRFKEPLAIDFNATPVYRENDQGAVKRFRFWLVDVQWDSSAIGEIAREHGIETIYYADLERLSILGIWNRYAIHIYGR